MDQERVCELLRERVTELAALPPRWDSAEVVEWMPRTRLTLERAVGSDHHLVAQFSLVSFIPGSEEVGYWFERGRRQAKAILEAAIYELEELSSPPTIVSDSTIDPELWEHVRHIHETEDWAKVASQTAIFVDRMRSWAGLPDSVFGKDLMTALLKPTSGIFPLGITPGEQDAWHLFGLGFAGACRNVDAHRIQNRSDLKPYACGVLGAGSLLLTQLRFQHGNSFRA